MGDGPAPELPEPFFRATTPDDRCVLEIREATGPTADFAWYVGTVTLDGTVITETLKTADSDKLIRWAYKQMAEAMRRCAKPEGESL